MAGPAREVPELPPLREVIARHHLAARRALGQNFLLDLNLIRRIVRAAGDLDGATVVEVGAGPGGLTRALLETGADHVYAVERDSRCVAALRELEAVHPGRLTVVAADALAVDPADLGGRPRHVVANLPYNIATRLLIGWLRRISELDRLTLMFQKEVAARLASRPRQKSYGRLSILVQWLCEVRPLFDVPARAFTPSPKVTSTLVAFEPRPRPLAPAPWEALEAVTAKAFGQRRKMLRSSLRGLGLDLAGLGFDPGLRAEELTVEQFCRLARAWAEATPGSAL